MQRSTPIFRAICAPAICLVALLLSAPTAGAAEETHIFEPIRSLTGACSTNKWDMVPDPNCPDGPNPPSGAFFYPSSVATDPHGDIYVGSYIDPFTSYITIFGPAGNYLSQFTANAAVTNLAIDSQGVLYTATDKQIQAYEPTTYDPEAGEISYPSTPTRTIEYAGKRIVLDRTNDHLVTLRNQFNAPPETSPHDTFLVEYGSYEEGNSVLREIPLELPERESPKSVRSYGAFALDSQTGEFFIGDSGSAEDVSEPSVILVLNHDGTLKETLTGVQTPKGFHEFKVPFGFLWVAVEEDTGHLFIADLSGATAPIYEVNGDREYVSTIEHHFVETAEQIVIDNSEESENKGYLFVPAEPSGTGHLYAFAPKPDVGPPIISGEAVSGVGTTEAVVGAEVNPHGLETSYRIEYVDAATYEADLEALGPDHGFDHALNAGGGTLSGSVGKPVTAILRGLSPGTAYRFRVVASNACEEAGEGGQCVSEGETASFATYPSSVSQSCPNEAARIGASGSLPDCRAYELVTPPSTNGQAPQAIGLSTGPMFSFPPASPDGGSLSFTTIGGSIGIGEQTGGSWGDSYVATRSASGWSTQSAGPNGAQAFNPNPGALSPDHRYSFWNTGSSVEVGGSLEIEQTSTGIIYLRRPDGTFQLLGEGSIDRDLEAFGLGITEGGTHVFFSSTTQLEPGAPPDGTRALYDRTPDGTLHVVSLLPGNVVLAAGEDASSQGASEDGSDVAFSVSGALYVRRHNTSTLEAASVSSGPPTFAGFSADGHYMFYLQEGDIYRFDTSTAERTAVATSGDASVVNVSADGNAVYFLSSNVLTSEPNPIGAQPQSGEPNLYQWRNGTVRFVGTVTQDDVEGENDGQSGVRHALGNWAQVSLFRTPSVARASNASRSAPDGSVLLFESRARLTAYENGGHREVYRYDSGSDRLECLSCAPTGLPAGSDAALMSAVRGKIHPFGDPQAPDTLFSVLPNLSPDGERAFFETSEQLVAADTDGVDDVYQWEAQGKGGCAKAGGCVSLISSGNSAQPSRLFGISRSGDDVFFQTVDRLTAADVEATPSVYDARVGGGFPEAEAGAAECLGEACQPAARAPQASTPASSSFHGAGNPVPAGRARRCPKGKRKVRRRGKVRCVRRRHRHRAHRRHHHRKRHRRSHSNGRAGR